MTTKPQSDGRIRLRLLRSHLMIGLLGVAMLITALVGILGLRSTARQRTAIDGPTVRNATIALGGVQRSLAALRGWVAFEESTFQTERASAWADEIRPAMGVLHALSSEWHDDSSMAILRQANQLLDDLEYWQRSVEDITVTPGNEPARVVYAHDIKPLVEQLETGMAEVISMESERINGGNSLRMKTMADFRFALIASQTALAQFLDEGTDEHHAQSINEWEAAQKHLRRVDEQLNTLTDPQQEVLAWMRPEMDAYEPLATQVKQLRKAVDWNQSRHALATEIHPRITQITTLLSALAAGQTKQMAVKENNASTLSNVVVLLLTVLVVCMALLAYFLANKSSTELTRSIDNLVDATRQMASGSLQKDVSVTTDDEIGTLTEAFNTMRKSLEAAERKLTAKAEELERSNRDLQQFAYVASHDLQEPLRAVAGFTDLLQSQYGGQLDEQANSFLQFAVDGAKRMQTLINNLLDYARVGSEGNAFSPVDCQEVIELALHNLNSAIQESQADLSIRPLPTVHGDKLQLVRVFQNLIGNAIKFRGEAAPRIEVDATRINGEWQFAFRDFGIGIKVEDQQRVFVIFQRLHTRKKYPGTGIGLSICQRIIQRHGGSVWVESVEGDGCTFFFTLPAAEPHE